MARYKDARYLEQDFFPAFDAVLIPGHKVLYSGIYRCEGCGMEVAVHKGDYMTAQNHREHNVFQGAVRWKMIVATN